MSGYKNKNFHNWLFLLFVALPVIMLMESCGSTPYETIYTANILKEPSQRFQPGEQVFLVIKSTFEGPETERTLTDYKYDTSYTVDEPSDVATSTYADMNFQPKTFFRAKVENQTTGEEYMTHTYYTVGEGKSLKMEIYTTDPGLYSVILIWETRPKPKDEDAYPHADPIQFEVVGNPLPSPKHSDNWYQGNPLSFLNKNIRDKNIRGWLKDDRTNVRRGWTETYNESDGIKLFHNLNGDITKVTVNKKYALFNYLPQKLSFSKTRREIEETLGTGEEINFKPDKSGLCPLVIEYPQDGIIINYGYKMVLEGITPEDYSSRLPEEISFIKR